MKAIILVLHLFSADSLPFQTPDSLFASLRRFHVQQLETDLIEWQILEKKPTRFQEALKWMPQIGTSYNLLTDKIRPTIGYNFNQVYSNIKEKQRLNTEEQLRNAKIQKILRGADLAFKTDSLELLSLIKKQKALERSLAAIQASLLIQDDIFEKQKERFKSGLILPIEFEKIQLEKAKAGEPYWLKLEEIDLLVIEILKKAKY